MLKSIGIVRKVDELGRLVIPKETRVMFDIKNETPLEFFVDDKKNQIILQVYEPGCLFCGSIDNLVIHKSGRMLCKDCILKMLAEAEKDPDSEA